MLTRKKTGPTLSTARIKRKQKRKKRRLVEAVDQDWARWDAAAESEGLNFAEFARRALNNYVFLLGMRNEGLAASTPVRLIPDPVDAGK